MEKQVKCPYFLVEKKKALLGPIVSFNLTITTLWASADDRLMIFFFFFPENMIWHFMSVDNLHEMSSHVLGKIKKKYFKM